MFRIRLPNGEESEYESADDFTLAVQRGAVTPDAAIFHAKAERWVPVSSHPTYHRAVSATRPSVRPIHASAPRAAVQVAPVAPAITAPSPALNVDRPKPPALKPSAPPAGDLELLLPDPMLAAASTAHRVAPPPSPSPALPTAAPLPRQPYVARAAAPAPAVPAEPAIPVTPAEPAEPAAPARRPDGLVFVQADAPESTAHPTVPSPRVSAPRQAVIIEPPPVVEVEALPLIQPEAAAPPAEAPAGFVGHDQMLAFDPVPAPEVHSSWQPEPKPVRSTRPMAVVAQEPAGQAWAPSTHREAPVAYEPPLPGAFPRVSGKSSGNSPRLLLIAAVVVLMVAGVGLVAWRSGASKDAEAQPAPATRQPVTAPAPSPAPAPEPAPVSPLTRPMTSQPVAPPSVAEQAPAKSAATPPAPDSSAEILPGRPQSMAMDIDVSGAAVGQEADAGSDGASVPLATVTDRYGDAATAAASQLGAQMNQIGFSKLLAPVRFSSVEGMEGARHTISSAAGMLASYRGRIQSLEKAYGDSAAQSERSQKPSPRDLLGWEHRLPNRETPEAAQVVDLSLTQVDSLFAALLQHPEMVKVSGETVTISDPTLNQQYGALKEWLGQKLDAWGDAPAATVPPTVQQVLNAFVKGAAR
jgi:hypothetical protein